jgi:plastocyanin
MTRAARRHIAVVILALGVAGCGRAASSPEASLPEHDVLVQTALGTALRFEPIRPSATGTRLQLLFRNASTMPHNLTFENLDARTQTIVGPGADELVAISVPGPGEYSFVCTIHPTMTGVLSVT